MVNKNNEQVRELNKIEDWKRGDIANKKLDKTDIVANRIESDY